ncbi:MAG: class I SAM-dependent methyltransferase [Polyangiaceae bacterium]|nr:class I SAM-dependent methyltransferase [Polyangiaceae bacterium]
MSPSPRVASFWLDRYPTDAFSRLDEASDAKFYATARQGPHVDALALRTVQRVVGTLLTEYRPRVLDLMAGTSSHLPADLDTERVVGLGLDEQSMVANGRLSEYRLQDLNQNPELPFADESFDAVLNTLSVGYLTRPFEVFAEAARVLKPGGLMLVVFSDRLFRAKAVKLWRDASGSERKMLVEEYFASTRAFTELHSFVSRGRPRPHDDPYAGFGIPSDSIWAVYSDRRGAPAGRGVRPGILPVPLPGPSREDLERRKREVRYTLRCPYCDEPLIKFELASSPFCEWPNAFMYVCFNNDCPYLVGGWQVMNEQGNPGFSYRLMYNPEQDRCLPVPVPSVAAAREYTVTPRG